MWFVWVELLAPYPPPAPRLVRTTQGGGCAPLAGQPASAAFHTNLSLVSSVSRRMWLCWTWATSASRRGEGSPSVSRRRKTSLGRARLLRESPEAGPRGVGRNPGCQGSRQGSGEDPEPSPLGSACAELCHGDRHLCDSLERRFLGEEVKLTRKVATPRLAQAGPPPGWAGGVSSGKVLL